MEEQSEQVAGWVLTKLNFPLPHDRAITVLHIYSKELQLTFSQDINMDIHCKFVQHLGASRMVLGS